MYYLGNNEIRARMYMFIDQIFNKVIEENFSKPMNMSPNAYKKHMEHQVDKTKKRKFAEYHSFNTKYPKRRGLKAARENTRVT